MKVIIVHGWRAGPDSEWYQDLAGLLRGQGMEAAVMQLPRPNIPDVKAWAYFIEQEIAQPDPNTLVVAHSLGAFATLRALEKISKNGSGRIQGALLIASPYQFLYRRLPNLIYRRANLIRSRQAVGKVLLLHSISDRVVSVANSQVLQQKLKCSLIEVPGVGHFIRKDGFDDPSLIAKHLRTITGA